ncbi:MAG: type II toxin-antitoxin system HicA family toxin [Chloroflexi bacterium]|nr:type II toxin-antitoxin system HicA family toxin [Chloroflexota bacterium]
MIGIISADMRTKHQRTLERIFKRPTPANIRWLDIVALLQAIKVEVSQRSGSRVLLKKGGVRMVVHRPHPEPQTGKATVRAIAEYLEALGEKP